MVQLVIKNPHMGPEHQSFSLEAPGSMTVKELKQKLTQTCAPRLSLSLSLSLSLPLSHTNTVSRTLSLSVIHLVWREQIPHVSCV